VLLVDDCNTLRAKVRHDLAQAGLEVELAEDGQAALERLQAGDFDAVVSDVQMPRVDGLTLLERCAGRLPVVLMTAYPEARGETRARQLGAAGYLPKDDRLGERILSVLNRFLSQTPERRP
jgi:CheY-like chemotaxis protein